MSQESRLDGAAWSRLRNDVLARDEHRCANCGSDEELEVHHVVPLSRGGTNAMTNLLTVCRACHYNVHDRSAPVEAENSEPDSTRWLPTIEDIRHLVRTTPHPLERAVIVLLAKTGLGSGEVCNLLLEDVALADAGTRELFNATYPSWADEPGSFLRVRGTAAETRCPSRRERSTTTIVPLDRESCQVLARWLAVRPDPIATSPPLFTRTSSSWGTPFSIDTVHHLVESRAKPLGLHGHDDQLENLTPYTLRYFFDERFAGQPAVREYILGRHSTLPMPLKQLVRRYSDDVFGLVGS